MSSPPLDLSAARAAIPERCFQPRLARSVAYLGFDLAAIALLGWLGLRAESAPAVAAYAFAQGSFFWSLFLIGHDCGHGSFSRFPALNSLVGHLTHAPLLVPFHGWRLSHRHHHLHTGDVDRDESWTPPSPEAYRELPWYKRWVRHEATLLFVFPLYLLRGTPSRAGSHFDAACPLFPASERRRVRFSAWTCALALAGLAAATLAAGPWAVLKLYVLPYAIFIAWIDLVTFLHHTDASVPWYRGRDWAFARGALSTVDRHYGIFHWLHHRIGSHVAHHLFMGIPHYHLDEATRALRGVLGSRYRQSREPILQAFRRSLRECRVAVPAGEGVLRYAPPRELP